MNHLVAPVVQHDIRCAEFINDGLEEHGIGLVPDADRDLLVLKGRTFRPNVDADDLRGWAKIVLPHLGRSPLAGTNLHEDNTFVAKWSEIPLIYRKIMYPLVNGWTAICPKVLIE